MSEFFKDLWWFLSEGWIRAFGRRVEDLSVYANVYRPVSKIKNTPVSGDALAPYSREWRRYNENRNPRF